jgi:(2S)-methylsuccinyl-CoA dehydrogenase
MGDEIDRASRTLDHAGQLLARSWEQFSRSSILAGKLDSGAVDRHQLPLYQLAGLSTRVAAGEQLLAHAASLDRRTGLAARLTCHLALLWTAETIRHILQQLLMRESEFGLSAAEIGELSAGSRWLGGRLAQDSYERIAAMIAETGGAGLDGLTQEQQAIQAAFRRFAQERIAPLAERIHRYDELLPDEIIEELGQMGCFGMSIPARYGGFQDDSHPDHTGMVIVSDELSRASFGTAGSLITRPELLSKALLKGGTEAQREKWLPLIASGALQVAVAVTEPDYGSDVANLTTVARPSGSGWRLNGTKMWCTYAGRAELLMVLARTDPDASLGHRGLSLFMVEKPADYGRAFEHQGIAGRAIATLGYRGMHSFELVFEQCFVPGENLIGGEAGLGQGFYLQMHGFGGSRLQTAGRALGIMAAAFAEALKYSGQRHVFGRPLAAYPLTGYKLVQMAMYLQVCRQLTYHAAREVDLGGGAIAASMAKLLTARAAEGIAREAQQLHGGMGYAEEFPISRHFVDARVLAIFEGAEEVLALRVIARSLLSSSRS